MSSYLGASVSEALLASGKLEFKLERTELPKNFGQEQARRIARVPHESPNSFDVLI
jgi:hypothetical protein